jgi:hypothetical protein
VRQVEVAFTPEFAVDNQLQLLQQSSGSSGSSGSK